MCKTFGEHGGGSVSGILASMVKKMTDRTKPPVISAAAVRTLLSTVLDPELGMDIVSLGLIYAVSVSQVTTPEGTRDQVHILMTLTTPGCPLVGTIEQLIRQSLDGISGVDAYRDVRIEITFDPPWSMEMMSEETKAQLGFDYN